MGEVRPLFRPGEREDEPPHSLEAEQAILGAILDNNRRFVQAETLRPEHFYDAMHGALFAEIARRVLANQLANAITLQPWLISVTQQAMSQEAASRYLVGLSGRMIGGDIGHYVQHIRELWARRLYLIATEEFQANCRDVTKPLHEAAIEYCDKLDAYAIDETEAADVSFDDALDSAVALIEATHDRGTPGGLRVPMFPRINRRLRFMPSQLTILAGASGEGKSAIGWQMFMSAAEDIRGQIERGTPLSVTGGLVGLSFEMSKESLALRAISPICGISVEYLETGVLNADQIRMVRDARETLRKLPIRLIAVGGLTPTQIKMRMRQAQRKLGGAIAMVMIDHVQLVEPDDQHARNGGAWATGKVADAILRLCKDFSTHVVALSQVDSKDIAKRPDHRPTVDDLRWSANFRNNADYIAFVYRHEAHLPPKPIQDQLEDEAAYDERVRAWETMREKHAGKGELYGAKARNGASFWRVPLFFDGATTSFSEDKTQPDV